MCSHPLSSSSIPTHDRAIPYASNSATTLILLNPYPVIGWIVGTPLIWLDMLYLKPFPMWPPSKTNSSTSLGKDGQPLDRTPTSYQYLSKWCRSTCMNQIAQVDPRDKMKEIPYHPEANYNWRYWDSKHRNLDPKPFIITGIRSSIDRLEIDLVYIIKRLPIGISTLLISTILSMVFRTEPSLSLGVTSRVNPTSYSIIFMSLIILIWESISSAESYSTLKRLYLSATFLIHSYRRSSLISLYFWASNSLNLSSSPNWFYCAYNDSYF